MIAAELLGCVRLEMKNMHARVCVLPPGAKSRKSKGQRRGRILKNTTKKAYKIPHTRGGYSAVSTVQATHLDTVTRHEGVEPVFRTKNTTVFH